jgi:hypothetical protein
MNYPPRDGTQDGIGIIVILSPEDDLTKPLPSQFALYMRHARARGGSSGTFGRREKSIPRIS